MENQLNDGKLSETYFYYWYQFLVAKQLTISLLCVRTCVRTYVRTDQLAFFNITQPYQFRFKRDKGQRWSNHLIQLN